MAKVIMVQGTMSSAGKSFFVAGLCRVFAQDGYRVMPFKSQNMANNSYVTKDGYEMGRAQAMQAEACRVEPDVKMNPVLLKPSTDMGSQVIVNGKVRGYRSATDYFAEKKSLIPDILKAYEALAEEADIIVVEGAGSPAEINLKKDDIVNMGLAERLDAPVILVGDIDRGGVFAQLYGTIALLEKKEQDRIKGMVINKFRGDKSLLSSGLALLEEKCNIPVLGVLPYLQDVHLEEEDSLAPCLDNAQPICPDGMGKKEAGHETRFDIAVIRFPRISNFTDLQALQLLCGASVRYVSGKEELGKPDLLILPGTKSTMSDLLWLKERGMDAGIIQLAKEGVPVFGICGGYQMLGTKLYDDEGGEGGQSMDGLGLLPIHTRFLEKKQRTRRSGQVLDGITGIYEALCGLHVSGYELHTGQSVLAEDKAKSFLHLSGFGTVEDGTDGYVLENVAGTYLHGFFDSKEIRRAFYQIMCRRKGQKPEEYEEINYQEYKEQQFDRLADAIRESLDMEKIYDILGMGETLETKKEYHWDTMRPDQIEKRSFEIIGEKMGDYPVDLENLSVVKRVIHTSADFDYLTNLVFSKGAVSIAREAIRNGAVIVTDTQMARAGINKKKLAAYGGEVFCFMSDDDVAEAALRNKTTRAVASMDKACRLGRDVIFAIGNAPTALIHLYDLIQSGQIMPKLIIGVPVGFVNVVDAKEHIMEADVPYIVARGNKGGSNIAAAICNALIYGMQEK